MTTSPKLCFETLLTTVRRDQIPQSGNDHKKATPHAFVLLVFLMEKSTSQIGPKRKWCVIESLEFKQVLYL